MNYPATKPTNSDSSLLDSENALLAAKKTQYFLRPAYMRLYTAEKEVYSLDIYQWLTKTILLQVPRGQ